MIVDDIWMILPEFSSTINYHAPFDEGFTLANNPIFAFRLL